MDKNIMELLSKIDLIKTSLPTIDHNLSLHKATLALIFYITKCKSLIERDLWESGNLKYLTDNFLVLQWKIEATTNKSSSGTPIPIRELLEKLIHNLDTNSKTHNTLYNERIINESYVKDNNESSMNHKAKRSLK